MSSATEHNQISYIEFTSTDLARTKAFYGAVFGWKFKDWGPDYIGIEGAGVEGGFAKGEAPAKSSPLIVLYSKDLKATEDAIVAAGGSIVVPTFDFPGGRRFHFSDSVGNVLAVWSE
jgi:predicted enzyme related to lactoylglutathione lyase